MVSLEDAFNRHQLYLEGYKNGLDGRLDPILMGMYDQLSNIINKTNVESMNQLTRKQLKKLIGSIYSLQLRRHDSFRANMLKELRDLLEGDTKLNIRIMEKIEDKKLEEVGLYVSLFPLVGASVLARILKKSSATALNINNKDLYDKLWSTISKTPNPASGIDTRGMLTQYTNYLTNNIKSIINRAYTNAWTKQQTINEIFGTRARRFKDGFISKARRNGGALLSTLAQHVSTLAQSSVASLFYSHYQWVSVLDNFTTKICRFRAGLVYEYWNGPLPPAHFRCRSKAVPIKKGNNYVSAKQTFYEWLVTQPKEVQEDYLGVVAARKLRKGEINASDVGRFKSREYFTLPEFLAKYANIVK